MELEFQDRIGLVIGGDGLSGGQLGARAPVTLMSRFFLRQKVGLGSSRAGIGAGLGGEELTNSNDVVEMI